MKPMWNLVMALSSFKLTKRERFSMTIFGRRVRLATHISMLIVALAAQGQVQEQLENRAGNQERIDKLAEVVSLSASTITQILQREPGLLLEVKKSLVRKAYEQGRLLDPEDLSDEALFQLLAQDSKVRSLATHEIEARMYVRAKPTADQLKQNLEWNIVEKSSFQTQSVPGSGEPVASS